MEQRLRLVQERAERIVMKAADRQDADVAEEHPEMKKLRRLQQVETSHILNSQSKGMALTLFSQARARKKRRLTPLRPMWWHWPQGACLPIHRPTGRWNTRQFPCVDRS